MTWKETAGQGLTVEVGCKKHDVVGSLFSLSLR